MAYIIIMLLKMAILTPKHIGLVYRILQLLKCNCKYSNSCVIMVIILGHD
jgi:hypothetical protein